MTISLNYIYAARNVKPVDVGGARIMVRRAANLTKVIR